MTAPVADVFIPVRTVSEANSHTHWRLRQKRAKAQRYVVLAMLRARCSYPWKHGEPVPLIVTITRLSSGLLDTDNLAGASKHCRDSVAEWLGRGDGPNDGIEWRYQQERCKRGEFGVRVRVEVAEQGKAVA